MTAEHRRQTAKPGKTGKPKKTGKPRKTGKPEKYERGTRSYTMSHIRGKDTSIERMVRSFLFAKGLRFRKNDKRYPGHPDVVLPKYRTIIFVNGCFWHMHEGCPKATRVPKSNVEFWPRNCCAITNETRGSAPNSKRTAGKSSWCGNASSVRRCATNGWNGFTAKSWTIPERRTIPGNDSRQAALYETW